MKTVIRGGVGKEELLPSVIPYLFRFCKPVRQWTLVKPHFPPQQSIRDGEGPGLESALAGDGGRLLFFAVCSFGGFTAR